MSQKPIIRQRLQLIQRANVHRPSIYRLERAEHLVIHQDGRAYIANADTGVANTHLGFDGVKGKGYSPAKLLAGSTDDQFVEGVKPSQSSNFITALLGATALLVLLGGAMMLAEMPDSPKSTFISQASVEGE